jgi:hypothetical protein
MKKYTTLQISKELHSELKDYCKKKGFKLSGLVETLIRNKIETKPHRTNNTSPSKR